MKKKKQMKIMMKKKKEHVSLVSSKNFEEVFNEILEKYYQNSHNYTIQFYGFKDIHRVLILQLYGYEDEFYKSVQIKFTTQFFVSEFIVPLSNVVDFHNNATNLIDEVLSHYTQVVLSTKDFDLDQNKYDDTKIYKILLKQLNEVINLDNLCVIDNKKIEEDNNEDIDQENKSQKKLLYEFKLVKEEYVANKAKCNDTDINEDSFKIDEKLEIRNCEENNNDNSKTFLKLYDTKVSNKEGFSLEIFEPSKSNEENNNKSLSSQYQFYKKYPYKYEPILNNYVRSTLCHFMINKYTRKKIDENHIKSVFVPNIDEKEEDNAGQDENNNN